MRLINSYLGVDLYQTILILNTHPTLSKYKIKFDDWQICFQLRKGFGWKVLVLIADVTTF